MESQNNLGQYIKEKRREKKLSLRELEELSQISRAYLSILERGSDLRSGSPVKPTLATLQKLAKGLDLCLEELINASNSDELMNPAGAIPFRRENIRMLPVYGSVSAGSPAASQNTIAGYWPMDLRLLDEYLTEEEIEKSFYMYVKGDSLLPRVSEGDMVLIVPQPVENGDAALIRFNENEVCLKVVNYIDDKIILMSTNPNYLPVALHKSECEVMGKVLYYIGRFNKQMHGSYMER